MSLVIPKWTACDVADWTGLLVSNDDGQLVINLATAAILNYMPVIGITKLTSENVEDAWCRIAIHQALLGSYVEDMETGQPLFLTKSDLLRHVGVEAEGEDKSFAEFCISFHRQTQQQDEKNLPSFIANGRRSLLTALGLSGAAGFSDK